MVAEDRKQALCATLRRVRYLEQENGRVSEIASHADILAGFLQGVTLNDKANESDEETVADLVEAIQNRRKVRED